VEVIEYPELGMEAIWRIEFEDFPPSLSSTIRATTSLQR
jgi:tartrate dehydratase beta subunit/fumarate hydratase class I family protein